MAEAAMGGLGTISLSMDRALGKMAVRCRGALIATRTRLPRHQYAGWSLSNGDYFAMGSGPARAIARVEPLFEKLVLSGQGHMGRVRAGNAEAANRSGGGKSRQGNRAPAETLTFIYAPDTEHRRHCADRRAGARSGLAQGERSEISTGEHCRRHGLGTDAGPASGLPDRDGAHQRRHHLWRGRATLRAKEPPRRRRNLARNCQAMPRATMASPSPGFSSTSREISMPSIRCCSARPKSIVTAIESGDTFRAGSSDLEMLQQSLG